MRGRHARAALKAIRADQATRNRYAIELRRRRPKGPGLSIRQAAQHAEPFPISEMRRDWRYADELRRRHYDRELHRTVDRLLTEHAHTTFRCDELAL